MKVSPGPDLLVRRHAEHDDVDLSQRRPHDVVEAFAEQRARLVQARSVDHDQLRVGAMHDAAHGMPGGLRPVAGDRDLLPDERVEQRRLARVRSPDHAGESRSMGGAHLDSVTHGRRVTAATKRRRSTGDDDGVRRAVDRGEHDRRSRSQLGNCRQIAGATCGGSTDNRRGLEPLAPLATAITTRRLQGRHRNRRQAHRRRDVGAARVVAHSRAFRRSTAGQRRSRERHQLGVVGRRA